MFLRNDHGQTSGGGSAVGFAASAPTALVKRRARFGDFDFAPDLGSRIGTLAWYRGAATCFGLCALTLVLSPGFENPIYGYVPAPMQGNGFDAAQAIAPLGQSGQGGKTGIHVAATGFVAPLAETPERPQLNLSGKLPSGESLEATLRRLGIGAGDADHAVQLVSSSLSLGEIQPNTQLDITLGRRPDKSQPRPLTKLAFRANFGLKLEISGAAGQLALHRIPIAIDNTPLRVQGDTGGGLYRSARAAGAPAKAVEAYIKAVASRMPVGKLGSGCKFDLIVEQQRAETGEVKLGNLMYAGVSGCSSKLQLVRMSVGGKEEWFDGSGKGNRTGTMGMPVNGRISSGFGMRRHPILGYVRMHKGIDIAAPWGSPVYAANDGVVKVAGRSSGYGNLIRIDHGGGFGSGYGHLSRILVRPGEFVRRGELIGRVGNEGLSTGPHLHYENYRNGVPVNPRSVSFIAQRELTGNAMAALKARLAHLMAVPVGGPSDDEDAE